MFGYRFLGKVMSEYISVSIREGKRRLSILEEGFNYDRWVKTFCKSKQVIDVSLVCVWFIAYKCS